MHSSTLINLLSALPNNKLDALDKFLASPYFNTNPTLLRLFQLLKNHHPQFKSAVLAKEEMYAALFPEKPFVIASMRNLMTKLTELVRKFLAQEKYEESPELQDRLLLQQYGKYKVEKAFNDLYKKQIKRLEKGSGMDRFQCLEHYQCLELFQSFPYTDNLKLNEDHMRKMVLNLDRFFVMSKLILGIEINSRKQLLLESAPISTFYKSISKYIENLSKKDKPNFQLIQEITDLQHNPDKAKLNQLFNEFKNKYSIYSIFDSSALFKVFTNSTILIFRIRDSKYLKKMQLFYNFGVENGILIIDNSITITSFINVVTCGCRSGNIAWAQRFIDQNLIFLPPNNKEEVELLTRSIVNFERKNYALVNSTLSQIKLRDSKLGFHFRLLMIKNVIERALSNRNDAKDGLKNLDTIEKYIKRKSNKYSRYSLQFSNFIKIARRLLLDIKNEGRPNSHALKKMIKPNIDLAGRFWLIQRIRSFPDFNTLKKKG